MTAAQLRALVARKRPISAAELRNVVSDTAPTTPERRSRRSRWVRRSAAAPLSARQAAIKQAGSYARVEQEFRAIAPILPLLAARPKVEAAPRIADGSGDVRS